MVETIIYLTVIGTVVVAIVSFALDLLDIRTKTHTVSEVGHNAFLMKERLSEAARHAEGVNTGNSTFDTDPGVLELDMVDAVRDPAVFQLDQDDGTLQITEGTGGGSGTTPGQIDDDTQAEFDTGTYSDTQWDTDHVELTGTGQTNGTGTYTSEVFDLVNNSSFENISWTPSAPYGKPLPDNSATETAYSTGNMDMSNNVLLLHSDESAGSTTFSDTSGQGNDATCSGTQCPTADVAGRYNSGLDFDGTEDRISIPSNTSLEIDNNLTASAWVNIDQVTTPDVNPILWKGSQVGWGANYTFRIAVTNLQDMTWGVTYGGTEDWFEAGTITLNEWNHVALTYDGSTARAYINGVEVGTNGGGGSALNTFPSEPVRSGFGYRSTPTEETYLDGTVDEYGIWDRTLGPGEIQDMYERGMMRIEHQLRSCDDAACSGETFTGPDGTSGDVYSEADNTSTNLPSFTIGNQLDNQYFQYQTTFETDDASLNPELRDTAINTEGLIVDDTQSEFDQGAYNNTQWSTDHVALSSGQTSGTYSSQIFDTGDTATQWGQLSWIEDLSASGGLRMEVGTTTVSPGSSTAGQFVDDTQAEFDTGTYDYTQWSTDHVELTSTGIGNGSGAYTSEVFDAGSSDTSWDQISWSEVLPGTSTVRMEVGSVSVPGGPGTTPGQIDDDTQAEFDTGTYSDTQWDTDHVELTGTGQTNGTGTYTSEVFDLVNNSSFENISWTPSAPYGKPLPDNSATETAYSTGNMDMSNNVLLLHSDESAGSTTFSDTSGQGNDATCSGTQCPTADVAGRYNSGLDFDGTEDRISIPSNTSLEIDNNLTASAWVNIDQVTTPDVNPILWKGTEIGWGPNYTFRIALQDGGDMTWGVTYGGTEDWFDAGSITLNEWNHVALTYDGSTARAYINGVEVGTNGGGGSSLNTFPSEPVRSGFALRGEFPNQKTYLDGTVDEYGIWDRTLGPGEIQDMYERGMMRIEHQLRSCDDAACSGETFTGPDGTSGDVYSEADNTSTNLPSFTIGNQLDNQYFQYQTTFETDNASLNPELRDITIDYEEQTGGPNFETVNLQESYSNPVVVPLYHESNNTAAFSPRLRNVTSNSFDVALQNPGGALSNGDEVHYLVIEEGAHTMPDGTLIEAGELDTSFVSSANNGWSGLNRSYTNSYGSPPAVFHQVQTYNDTSWIESWVAQQGNDGNPPDTSGFQISLNGAEATDSHGSETIGWVAVEQGAGTVAGQDFEVSVTSDSIRGHDNGCDTFGYSNGYTSNPIVVADQQEMDGVNGGWLVGCSQSTSEIGVHAEEDLVGDGERGHTTETGAFAAFAGAFNISPVADLTFQVRSCDDASCSGENFVGPDGTNGTSFTDDSGQGPGVSDNRYFQYQATFESFNNTDTPELSDVTIDYVVGDAFQTVNLQETYSNPVVIPLYYESNNGDPISVRLADVTANSFDIKLQNPSGNTPATDDVHYVVIEEGAYTMPDGTLIEAASLNTNQVSSSNNGWSGVNRSYTNSYGSPPAVFHQVQTNNDETWIESWVASQGSRVNPPNTSGFQISLNGAEVTNGHGVETIGWMAIEQGTGTIDGVDFEASVTSDTIQGHDNGCYTFGFSNGYASNPIVVADQQKMDGPNGGWLVGCSLSASQIGLYVEEDVVNDSERRHTTETGAFLAFDSAFSFAPDVDLTFQVRSCDDASCVGESFVGPDGTGGTQFTTPVGESINVSDNQFFQYQATFTSSDTANTPELSSVTVDYTIPGTGGGGGSAVNVTSDGVSVTNLTFRNLTSSEDTGIIQVEFTITANDPNGNPLYQYEETYQTTLRIPFDN